MLGSIGAPEIAIIAVVLILLFGVGKLSGLGKDLGSSIKEFRRAMKDEEKQDEAGTAPAAQQPQTAQATVQQQPQAPQQSTQPAPAPEPNSQQPRQDAERPNVF